VKCGFAGNRKNEKKQEIPKEEVPREEHRIEKTKRKERTNQQSTGLFKRTVYSKDERTVYSKEFETLRDAFYKMVFRGEGATENFRVLLTFS
jgi:hypothetical protein